MAHINGIVTSKNSVAVTERVKAMVAAGVEMKYRGFAEAPKAKARTFQENLVLINPLLPEVLAWILLGFYSKRFPTRDLNNSPLKREGFDLAEAFLLGGSPRFAVTSTTKSFLTQSLYGEGRNPPPSEPPELALSDPFSGLNDYDTGVKPGCYSG